MALIQIKDYTHLISQEGNYIYFHDEDQANVSTINWTPLFPFTRANTVDCIVWMDRSVPGTYDVNFRDEPKKLLGTVGADYDIWVYGIRKHVTGAAYVIGNIVWLGESVWHCQANTSTTPSISDPTWIEIIETNTDYFLGYNADMSNMYAYRPVASLIEGNISVTKTGDHQFTITWLSTGTISAFSLRDYNGVVVEYDSGLAVTELDFVLTQDGVYYVEMGLSDGSTHYAEIYDFTDTEKCYLDLMKSILCDCIDCHDCPGKNYERALNYANTYSLLRDIVYADQSQLIGLISTDVLRQKYIKSIGLLVDKLRILSNECTCNDS